MNTHDIELPPFPKEIRNCSVGTIFHAGSIVPILKSYALTAIEPYQKRIAELEHQLEQIGAGGVDGRPLMNDRNNFELPPLPDIPSHSAELFDREVNVISEILAEQLMYCYARSAIEADRKRRGEPVVKESLTASESPQGWKEPAAKWLRDRALRQQAINELYPVHAEGNPSWIMWVNHLNWLADELSKTSVDSVDKSKNLQCSTVDKSPEMQDPTELQRNSDYPEP